MMKDKRGYSLTVLAITIAVIIIITTTAIVSIKNMDGDKDISKFMQDMNEVKQFVTEYYAKNNVLPVIYENNEMKNVSTDFYNLLSGENELSQISEDDVGEYYSVDLELLGKIHLNDRDRGYILNEGTLNVYIMNPFEYEGEKYYALTTDLTQTEVIPMEKYAFEINIAGNPIKWTDEAEILVSVTDLPVDQSAGWSVKWMKGTHKASDFNSSSTDIKNVVYGDTFTVTENGTYTVYVESPNKDIVTRVIVVTKIDDIAPTITYDAGKVIIDDAETGIYRLRCKIKESDNFALSNAEREAHKEYYTMEAESASDTLEQRLNKYLWETANITGDTVQTYLQKYENYYNLLTQYNNILGNADATSAELINAAQMIESLNDSYPQFAYNGSPFSNTERNIVLYVEDVAGNANVYSGLNRLELQAMQYISSNKEPLSDSQVIINNGNSETYNRAVKLSLKSLYAEYVFISEDSNATPVWNSFENNVVEFEIESGGDGEKTVYVTFKDAQGNTKQVSDSIRLLYEEM